LEVPVCLLGLVALRAVVLPGLRLDRAPQRHGLRDLVGPRDADEQEVVAQQRAQRGVEVGVAQPVEVVHAVEHVGHVVPHQLAAPHAVGRRALAQDPRPPLGGRLGVVARRVQRSEQLDHARVGGLVEVLARLARLAGMPEHLEVLQRNAGDGRRA
jgi:hypothetical protein